MSNAKTVHDLLTLLLEQKKKRRVPNYHPIMMMNSYAKKMGINEEQCSTSTNISSDKNYTDYKSGIFPMITEKREGNYIDHAVITKINDQREVSFGEVVDQLESLDSKFPLAIDTGHVVNSINYSPYPPGELPIIDFKNPCMNLALFTIVLEFSQKLND